MKTAYVAPVVALALAAAMPVFASQQTSGSAKLESLRGTLITMVSEDRGIPARIWAKGNNTRTELTDGRQKTVTIQLGDTMYTYLEGSTKPGMKQYLGRGLGSMGLIRQIEEIKAKGKQQTPEEIEGVRYDKYEYESNDRREVAVVYLSADTSLPRIWLSLVKAGEKDVSVLRMHYRDMQANVEIPDELFKLPPDVTFSEEPKNRRP
jgi:outer membrane lipoprotein-sorting protein